MKLTRFVGKALHGYLDFDVRLKDRLTFLTGINGSGKTTVLNGIVALISPDLATLQAIPFELMRLDFQGDDGKKYFIEARHKEDVVSIAVSTSKQELEYPNYSPDPALGPTRQVEAEAEHFREILLSQSGHPVLRFIRSLPTPMFLGLDRRARLNMDDRRVGLGSRYRTLNSRNVFGGSLATSLREAEELAEASYREARFRANSIGEELQQQVLLSLLTFTKEDYGALALPTDQEVKDLKRVQADLETFPAIFRLPKDEVEKRVRPFIDQLQKALDNIPRSANVHDDLTSGSKPPEYLDDLVTWSLNRSQIKKIKVISQTVQDFNDRRTKTMQSFEDYRSLVNGFLDDSGKSIEADERGDIVVRIEGVDLPKRLYSLSSGEAQLFVILTNLAFNPAAQKANVFLIDEPELSLHVRWQEMFVDSILSVNEKIQFVLATHSPSIILDRLSNCVEISGKRKRSSRA